jgi:hypothetical protein
MGSFGSYAIAIGSEFWVDQYEPSEEIAPEIYLRVH